MEIGIGQESAKGEDYKNAQGTFLWSCICSFLINGRVYREQCTNLYMLFKCGFILIVSK
jgi:hypothetical protein